MPTLSFLMRILFDNGTPRQLRARPFNHEIEEARGYGWDAMSNGELLDSAEEAGFDVLLTTNQSLGYQQNMSNGRIAVVALMNACWNHMSSHTELFRSSIVGLQLGEVREVPIPPRDE